MMIHIDKELNNNDLILMCANGNAGNINSKVLMTDNKIK